MDNKVFREKSVKKFSSPEQLNDYIKVSNPSVWMLLAAIAILLAGICIWAMFGRTDTRLTVAAKVEEGKAACYVKEKDMAGISVGMETEIGGESYHVLSVSLEPAELNGTTGESLMHIGGIEEGERIYEVALEGSGLPDGIYEAGIILEDASQAALFGY